MTPRERRTLLLLILVVAPLLSLGLMWLFGPRPAHSTGTLAIPNVIGAQSGPNIAASLLDTNWNTIRDYVNNREIDRGAASARPSAQYTGRLWVSSDVGGGTLYRDNGTTWDQISAPVLASGSVSNVRGLIAGTASLTVVNASATLVNLRSPSDGSVVIRTATSTLSNDALTAGSAANGRDQSAQFTAGSWVHLYYIWNGTTLATLSSACAPSDVNSACSSQFGPNLPTGYTHTAYIGAYRWRDTQQYWLADQRGSWVTYRATPSTVNVITGGVEVTETAVSVATAVASNAVQWRGNWSYYRATANDLRVRLYANRNENYWRTISATADMLQHEMNLPNVNQNFYYLWALDPGAANRLTVDVLGYQIPNGD